MARWPVRLSEQRNEMYSKFFAGHRAAQVSDCSHRTEHHLGHEWTFSEDWMRGAAFQNELHANTRFLFQGNSRGAVAVSKPNPRPWEEACSHDCKQAAPWSLLLRNEKKTTPHPCSVSWSKVKAVCISHCRPALALNRL